MITEARSVAQAHATRFGGSAKTGETGAGVLNFDVSPGPGETL
ncbi:hypothetical protein PAMC26510_08360 [Caballeronia sordidicola]|uniref:Uncharacterized protein n=1 Tax=Caballeronia sordidicola TaxID=196367 RepID=A0A242N1X4_CABSO|nr:hypothetical protein PAMC26510_08360 [Caballeronia sordidicola]